MGIVTQHEPSADDALNALVARDVLLQPVFVQVCRICRGGEIEVHSAGRIVCNNLSCGVEFHSPDMRKRALEAAARRRP